MSAACPRCGAELARVTVSIHVPDNVQLTPGLMGALLQAQTPAAADEARYRCAPCGLELTPRDLVDDWAERGAGLGVGDDEIAALLDGRVSELRREAEGDEGYALYPAPGFVTALPILFPTSLPPKTR